MKLLKGFFALIVILLLVVAAGITFLLVGVDPNSYKPELAKLAKQNNIQLTIDGDLGWSFFPNLAVQAGTTTITSIPGKNETGIPDIQFQQADFILDWKALVSRTVRLSAIAIDGAVIKIESAEEAANVAAAPGAAAATQKTEKNNLPFELAIDQLSLTNSRITLATPGEPDKVLEQLNFTSKDLNLDGRAFPITLSVSTTLPDQPSPIAIAFDSQLKFQLEEQVAELTGSTLKLDGIKKLPIELDFNALYEGQKDSIKLSDVSGKVGSATIKAAINILQLQTTPSATGQLSIQDLLFSELAISGLLGDEPPEGFKKLDINTEFSASEALVKLDQLKLALDNFNIGGNLSLKLEGPRKLEMALKGGHLVLPTTSEESGEGANNQAVLLTPILAPLALLEGGKGHIELNLDSVTSDNIKVEQLHLNLFSNGKVLDITDLSGAVFGGKFQVTTKVDLKNKTPKVKFSKQLTNIDIYNALSTLADQSDVRGRLTMNFNGTSSGDTQDALMANVVGNGKLSVSELQIENINVERSYCEMAALVEKVAVKQTWANYTRLKDLQSDIHWKNQIITLPNLTTGMGNVAVAGNGTVNLEQEAYNMLITANLQSDSTSEDGCHIKSKSIRNRDIPLRCTGSFAENGEGKCRPDKQFINQLLQDKIKDKLFDKFLKPKSDAKTTDSTEGATQEEPKDIKEQVIENLLKGIFQ